jgi:hypothetical protein
VRAQLVVIVFAALVVGSCNSSDERPELRIVSYSPGAASTIIALDPPHVSLAVPETMILDSGDNADVERLPSSADVTELVNSVAGFDAGLVFLPRDFSGVQGQLSRRGFDVDCCTEETIRRFPDIPPDIERIGEKIGASSEADSLALATARRLSSIEADALAGWWRGRRAFIGFSSGEAFASRTLAGNALAELRLVNAADALHVSNDVVGADWNTWLRQSPDVLIVEPGGAERVEAETSTTYLRDHCIRVVEVDVAQFEVAGIEAMQSLEGLVGKLQALTPDCPSKSSS